MTTTVDAFSEACLMKASAAVERANYYMGLAVLQKAKDDDAAVEQAIEHFMDERTKLREEIEQANDVLLEITRYATQLQEVLNQAGIMHRADPYTGEPVVSININRLQEYLRAAIDRS